MRQKLLSLAVMMAVAFTAAHAAVPSGYYDAAKNKNQKALLTALHNIVGSHGNVGYDGLWAAYKTTDVTTDGKYYWDMYATTKFPLGTKHCGSYSSVGDCVNREHSFPKSWWGGNKADQYSDLFHLYPTDGFVNNQRSNYPFGECANGTYLPTVDTNKPLGKLGPSTRSGYTGKVFEPDDEYKGDFARTYFGLAAAYNDKIASWTSGNGSAMIAGNNYPVFTTWALEMLLEWHRLDPVSEKELKRNDAMYMTKQNNRNPFIDHPELAEYIWGTKKDQLWTGSESAIPTLVSPGSGSTIDFGIVAMNTTSSQVVTVKGNDLSKDLTVTVTGNHFACATTTLSASAVNSGTTITVTFDAPATAQQCTGTLVIASDEVSVSVPLQAQSVTGIPALAATEVTTSSFTARWTPMGDATTYQLHLLQDDGETPVAGYPVNVTASSGRYLVTGLEASTTYYYMLTSSELSSNAVEVTTLDPTRIISIQTQGDFIIDAEMGKASPVLEAQVYTEYIDDEIELTVSGNFEISLNKQEWAQQLSVDPEGETFYVRIQDTATAGTFDGLLTASTATLDGADVEIEGNVVNPSMPAETVLEDFESINDGGYWKNGEVKQGTAFAWAMSNAGVWGQGSDHYIGTKAVRLNGGSIAMAQDKANGASLFSFYAAPFGSDAAATITVSYSTNGGTTWTKLQDFNVTAASSAPAARAMARAEAVNGLQQYSAPLDVKGDIRFKLEQSGGKRVNIDNIEIADAQIQTSVVNRIETASTWEVVPVRGGARVTAGKPTTIEVFNLEAQLVARVRVSGTHTIALPAGLYIVTSAQQSRKLVVK